MLSLQPLQNYFDSLISMTRGWTETGIATSEPGSVGSVSRLWVQLAFAPVAHVLNAIVRFERSQIAAPADEPTIAPHQCPTGASLKPGIAAPADEPTLAAPITAEVFARCQQPLHPSWLGMLQNVAAEFVSANISDGQPDDAIATPAKAESQPLYQLKPVTDAVAYFANTNTGEIQCTYAGFSNKQRANAWGQWLLAIPQVRFELRTAKRLQGFKWELKIKGLTIGQIQRLAGENLSKSPKIEFPAPKMATQQKPQLWRVKGDIYEVFSRGDELAAAEKFIELCDGRYSRVTLLDPKYAIADEWPKVTASPNYQRPLSKFEFTEPGDFDKLCPTWICSLDGKSIGKITERLLAPGFRHSRQRPNDATGYATRSSAAEALLASIKAENASIQRTRRIVLGDAFVDAFGGFAG